MFRPYGTRSSTQLAHYLVRLRVDGREEGAYGRWQVDWEHGPAPVKPAVGTLQFDPNLCGGKR